MASTYQRRQQWWIKFQHPQTKEVIRESLDTTDPARAELLLRRVELEVALLAPRMQLADLPPRLRHHFGSSSIQAMAAPPMPPAPAAPPPPAPIATSAPVPEVGKRVTLEEAARCYLQFIQDQNAPETRANKISMLRRFLGPDRAESVVGISKSKERFGKHRPKKGSAADVAFTGLYLDEVTPEVIQQFIERLNVAPKTKRHYREFFSQFFEVCIRFNLYRPANPHCPNPTSALPKYKLKNRRILYLRPNQIEEQHQVLSEYPAIQMAVDIMIHAGLRRSEVLWLAKESISPHLTFLSVVNGYDEEDDEIGSLKTGERPVTILPHLRVLLAKYLPTLKSRWLIPAPSGGRWSKDGFSRRLQILNAAHQLKWTCNIYRHTYATQRAAEGWPLFRIANEMGNSIAIVEQHYAAFVRPHELTLDPTKGTAAA